MHGRTLSVLVTPTPYCPAFLPFSLHLMFPLSASTHLSFTEMKPSKFRREREKTKLISPDACFQDQVSEKSTGTSVTQPTSSLRWLQQAYQEAGLSGNVVVLAAQAVPVPHSETQTTTSRISGPKERTSACTVLPMTSFSLTFHPLDWLLSPFSTSVRCASLWNSLVDRT